jgi:hypothetical protein
MRHTLVISCLLASGFLCSGTALAAKPEGGRPLLSMLDWHVAPVMDENGAVPDYCALAARYKDGPIVTFTRNAAGAGSLTLDFQNAKLETGRKYAVTTRVLARTHSFAARAIGVTRLVMQSADVPAIFDTYSLGHPLTISLDGTPGIYKLSGNINAFFQFDHCLRALNPIAEPVVTGAAPDSVQSVANPPVDVIPLDATGHEISWDDAEKTATLKADADRVDALADDTVPDDVKNRLKSTLHSARAAAAPQAVPGTQAPAEKTLAEKPAAAPSVGKIEPKIQTTAPVTAPRMTAPLNVPSGITAYDAFGPAPVQKKTIPAPMPEAPKAAPIMQKQIQPPMPMPLTPPPAPTWAQRTQAFLFASGLSSATAAPDATRITWHEAAGVTATAQFAEKNDVIDAANDALDKAESACTGKFVSQMGLPETHGAHTVQLLESKCAHAKGPTQMTTWLIDRDAHDTTIWHFHTDRDARAETFALRDAVYHAVSAVRS